MLAKVFMEANGIERMRSREKGAWCCDAYHYVDVDLEVGIRGG
jgi:hypothetical protein